MGLLGLRSDRPARPADARPSSATLTGDGETVHAALTGGFQWAFWVCGAIALLALPTLAVLRRKATTIGAEHAVPALETDGVS